MPSGWNADFPNDMIWDNGVVSIDESGSQVDIGVTRGGVAPEFNDEYRNVPFDGKRVKIAGLDRIIDSAPVITGTLLQFDEKKGTQFIPGATKVTAGTPAVSTITGPKRSTKITKAQLLKSPRIRYARSGGGTVDIKAPYALGFINTINAQDKSEGEFVFRMEAELDPDAVGFTTDDPGFVVVVTDP
jgi:hypothetical protein